MKYLGKGKLYLSGHQRALFITDSLQLIVSSQNTDDLVKFKGSTTEIEKEIMKKTL